MISIALATYNGEKYLREQIDSILNQTMQDFEVVATDDCSSDGTFEILKEYEAKDERFRVFRNEKNLGFKKNFEKAISLCSGEYVALCDQDDVWLERHLEVLLDNLGDASISCGNALIVDKDNNETGKLLNEDDGLLYIPKDKSKLLYRILFLSNPFQGTSMLIRKEFFKKTLPIPDTVPFHDVWFSSCACLENGINYTFECITRYRLHGENVTKERMEKRGLLEYLKQAFAVLKRKEELKTGRFSHIEELEKIYGNENRDFVSIKKVFKDMKKGKLTIGDVLFLWHNYEYISTRKSKRGFLRRLFVLMNLKDERCL